MNWLRAEGVVPDMHAWTDANDGMILVKYVFQLPRILVVNGRNTIDATQPRISIIYPVATDKQ